MNQCGKWKPYLLVITKIDTVDKDAISTGYLIINPFLSISLHIAIHFIHSVHSRVVKNITDLKCHLLNSSFI